MVTIEVLERIGNTIVSRLRKKQGIKATCDIENGTIQIILPKEVNEFNSISYEIDDEFIYNQSKYTIESEELKRLRDDSVFDGCETVCRYSVRIKEV